MGSPWFYAVDVLIMAVLVLIIIKVNFRTPKYLSFPPGPPAEPLIGHARLIPQEGQAEFYHENRKKYGTSHVVIGGDHLS